MRNPKGSSNKKEARRRKTVSVLKPPPGLQFLTVFDCKYYGSSTLGPEVRAVLGVAWRGVA